MNSDLNYNNSNEPFRLEIMYSACTEHDTNIMFEYCTLLYFLELQRKASPELTQAHGRTKGRLRKKQEPLFR